MKTSPPDRSSVVKELEKRLLKKWKDEKQREEPETPPKKNSLFDSKKNKAQNG